MSSGEYDISKELARVIDEIDNQPGINTISAVMVVIMSILGLVWLVNKNILNESVPAHSQSVELTPRMMSTSLIHPVIQTQHSAVSAVECEDDELEVEPLRLKGELFPVTMLRESDGTLNLSMRIRSASEFDTPEEQMLWMGRLLGAYFEPGDLIPTRRTFRPAMGKNTDGSCYIYVTLRSHEYERISS